MIQSIYKRYTLCRWGLTYLATAFILILFCGISVSRASELRLYAGAGLRQPVDRIVDNFQKKTGIRVVVDYDGSGRLMARFLASGEGDLFMPGSLVYIERLEAKGLVHSKKHIAAHTPVIAVNRAKKDEIRCLEDLARPGVKVALGDPKAMALGKTAAVILERSGMKEKISANVAVYGATVKQLALYAAEGTVDAAIVARTDAIQFGDRVSMITIPDTLYEPETVGVAVLKTTADREAACLLRDFLSSPQAVTVFTRFGFLPLKQHNRAY